MKINFSNLKSKSYFLMRKFLIFITSSSDLKLNIKKEKFSYDEYKQIENMKNNLNLYN